MDTVTPIVEYWNDILNRSENGDYDFTIKQWHLKRLLAEIDRLNKLTQWIPVSNPPKHTRMVVLADFRDTSFGLCSTTGWYDLEADKWIYPNNYNNMTHYMDCLYGNPTEVS